MASIGSGNMDHGQHRPRLPSMCTGQSFNHQPIEGIGAVEIYDRLAFPRPLRRCTEAQSKDKCITIKEEQLVIRMKGHLSVAQRQEPILNRLASAACRGSRTLTLNKWKFRCFYSRMHTPPRLSTASTRKNLPLLTGDPTGLA